MNYTKQIRAARTRARWERIAGYPLWCAGWFTVGYALMDLTTGPNPGAGWLMCTGFMFTAAGGALITRARENRATVDRLEAAEDRWRETWH